MSFETKVKIPANSLRAAVRLAYDMSVPVGMGVLNFRPEPLDDATLEQIVDRADSSHPGPVVRMDYVHGRCCKFTIYADGKGGFYVNPTWYDHTQQDLVELLTKIGINNPRAKMTVASQALEAENAKWDEENAS